MKKQLGIFSIFLIAYALIIFLTMLIIPLNKIVPINITVPTQTSSIPPLVLGLMAAGFVILIYGLLGLVGYLFSRKLDLPGIYREHAGWRAWFLWPMMFGLGMGIILVIIDQLFAAVMSSKGLPHPAFPLSLISSATAGIGEEILFRAFVMGLWAFVLNLFLRKRGKTKLVLWTGNIIAALAFSAAHLPSAMQQFNVTNPAKIPILILVEGLILNSLIGLVAGERYVRDGLVAAIGVHFWADIAWHVIWPLLGLGI